MSPTLRFINRDLRLQSFRGRSLQNAQFQQCDLRGCDFFQADLRGAKFEDCRVGPQDTWAITLSLTGPFAGFLFHAVSSLIFAAMGTRPGDPAGVYVQILTTVLAISTLSAGLQTGPGPFVKVARITLGIAVAALMGFFYVGSWADNSAAFAIAGASVWGLLGGLLTWRWQTPAVDASLGMCGAVAAYGYAFWTWTTGSHLVTTGNWPSGLAWAAIALLAIGITLRSLWHGGRALRRFSATSFRNANLTGCTFSYTDVTHCDLTNAIR
ncbi:MAG: pentapeptide repeat-containing protein [Cyanobacteria bacterium P01_H01_bin.162]